MTDFQNNEKVSRGVRGHAPQAMFWMLTFESLLPRVSDRFP